MGIGGIEDYQVRLMRYCIDRGYRIVWLTTEAHEKESAYKGITSSSAVEKYYVKRTPFGPIYPSIEFDMDEDVVALTTDLLRYCISQPTMKGWKCRSLCHVLAIPHYKGGAILPETILRAGRMRERWRGRLANAAMRIDRAGALVGFDNSHLIAFEREYGLSVGDRESKTLKAIFPLEIPSKEAIEMRAFSRKESFDIITCARFDFPHKGYILGLIDAFGGIYKRHPEVRLVIVGYGQGEQQVRDAVSRLPEAVRMRIELTGSLSPEQLRKKMLVCHLNVGVANSLWRGAECALPSICMRHYTLDCEGYGFIDEVEGAISDAPGSDMTPLIESIIEMDDDAYISKSLSSFEVAQARINADPEFVFRLPATEFDLLPMPKLKTRLMFFQRLFLERVCKRPMYEDQLNAR